MPTREASAFVYGFQFVLVGCAVPLMSLCLCRDVPDSRHRSVRGREVSLRGISVRASPECFHARIQRGTSAWPSWLGDALGAVESDDCVCWPRGHKESCESSPSESGQFEWRVAGLCESYVLVWIF
ncbi:hypothetical protein C8T65DRAFT_676540 [Cerioporus squamosus]|nr:hypothetical protein C8T65DRAFT_676540 [Cerioporus squamosus]